MPIYSQKSDDDTLWSGIQAGSDAAFNMLYRRYFRELFAYGKSLTTHEEVVKDAIQDLFLEIWRKRQVLSQAQSVKFYLLGSLRRRIHRIQKPLHKHSYTLESFHEALFPAEDSPETDFVLHEGELLQQDQLKNWLKKLPPRQQEALVLRYYHDLRYSEVADLLGIQEQTARNLVQKALAILRKISILLIISSLF